MKKTTIASFLILYILFSCSLVAQQRDSLSSIRSQVEYNEKLAIDPVTSFWDELTLLRDKTPDQLSADDIRDIESKISYLEIENERLDVILNSITELNPFFKEYLPQYIVEDEEMQIRLVNQLRTYFGLDEFTMNKYKRDIRSGQIQIRVIQKPLTEEELEEEDPDRSLIAIYLDNFKIVGSQTLMNVLGENLYSKLLEDADKFKMKRGDGPLYKEPKFATADLSLNGGKITINLQADTALIKVGVNATIGYDILNVPFWYGAVWNISGFFQPDDDQYYMVGTLIPFRPGTEDINLVGPLQLTHRKLNGTNGISAEFGKKIFNILLSEDDWVGDSYLSIYLGGSFSYSDLKNRGDHLLVDFSGSLINWMSKNEFYMITNHLVGYIGLTAPSLLKGVRLDVGYGSFGVQRSVIDDLDGETVKKLCKTTISDVYAKLAYHHEGVTEYWLSGQYMNQSIMLTGALQIFPWLGIEVKYSRIIGRDPGLWEHGEYISVSPKFSFSF